MEGLSSDLVREISCYMISDFADIISLSQISRQYHTEYKKYKTEWIKKLLKNGYLPYRKVLKPYNVHVIKFVFCCGQEQRYRRPPSGVAREYSLYHEGRNVQQIKYCKACNTRKTIQM